MPPARTTATGPGRAALIGVVSGVAVAASVPPFGWWPLGWLGLAGLALALRRAGWKARLAAGAAFGLGDYLIGLWWVQEFSEPGYFAVVVISALYAVAAVVAVPTGRRRWVAVAFPAAMVVADWARDRFPVGGLPLGGIALGQAAGPLVPVARLGGSLAVVGLTALVGVTLAELWCSAWDWIRGRERNRRVVVLVAALVASAVALPVAGALSPSGAGGHLPSLRVGLVQGGGPRGTRAINTDPQVVFQRHLDASAWLRPPLDLVVWPEGVLQSSRDFRTTADAADLADLAVNLGCTLLSGVEQDVGSHRYLNEVVAWGPQGRIVGIYVKNHLVPFGEYVPYRSFFQRFFNLADVPYDGIPGHGPGFLSTPAAPLGIMISYEVFFDERARSGVVAGGQLLVVPTNTASYRSTQVPTQEVAADRLRAWETGRWLVQVTPTGYSAVVSPTGAVVAKSRLGARQVIEATVGRRRGWTVYDHLGDRWIAGAALVAWGGVVLAAARRRYRSRSRSAV